MSMRFNVEEHGWNPDLGCLAGCEGVRDWEDYNLHIIEGYEEEIARVRTPNPGELELVPEALAEIRDRNLGVRRTGAGYRAIVTVGELDLLLDKIEQVSKNAAVLARQVRMANARSDRWQARCMAERERLNAIYEAGRSLADPGGAASLFAELLQEVATQRGYVDRLDSEILRETLRADDAEREVAELRNLLRATGDASHRAGE